MQAWLDGKFLDWREIVVSPMSHVFSRGLAIFEVALVTTTQKGLSIFVMDDHMRRFYKSADLVHMKLPYTPEELAEACKELCRRNRVSEGLLKYFAYFSTVEMETVPSQPEANIAIYCGNNADFGFNPAKAGAPKTACLSGYRKMHTKCIPNKAKVTGAYVTGYLAQVEVAKKGCGLPLFLDGEGFVAEGPIQSVFFVKDGAVLAPPLERVLAGTTRKVVLEAAADAGLTVIEKDILPGDLSTMDEAFCAGSVSRLSGIASIDGKEFGPDCPGPVTQKVMAIMDRVYSLADGKYAKYHYLVD